ncbi:MAG: HAMP domain-containing protein [bacterium]|nr:MAG: HAMP domain-containing protein [bacterium]
MSGTSGISPPRSPAEDPDSGSAAASHTSPDAPASARGSGFRVKIGWKITSFVLLVMVCLAVVNILFIRNRFNAVMNLEFESKAKALALSIARSSEANLVSGDVGSVQTFMENYKDVRGVVYLFVQDAKGDIVAGTFEEGFSQNLQNLLGMNPLKGEEEFNVARFRLEGVGDVLEVAVPILFGAVGTARVGMDQSLITGEMSRVTRSLIWQFAVASAAGVVLLHLMVIFLLRHIKTILGVLQKVGEGNLATRVQVPTRDEFLDLALNLNATFERLGSIIRRVDHSSEAISQANVRITQVYNDVLEGSEQQAGLASETMDSVHSNKKMIEEVTEGIHVLENSANDSFSSIMEMGASIEEVSTMAESLFQSVNESNQAIEDLSASIGEISQNLQNLSKASDETASAMNEMSASIVQVRGNAESTAQDAVQMTHVAEEGASLSKGAMQGMMGIKESSAQVSQMIALVSERIEEIDEILKFITDITGKTNLLALNAAIIAAQAGAQGKGFGVVADEINELAQSTKAQTNRIAQVIEGLRQEVAGTSEAVEVSNRKVDDGVSLVEKVTSSLEGIMERTLEVSTRVEEIAQTTSEQANTSNRVLQTTEHLTQSVGNIRGVSEQQAEASRKLIEMSKVIRQVAQKVKTSTEEQTVTSQQINKDLTRISETVRGISESTEIQLVNGSKVLKMTEDLGGVIEKNRVAVHGLQEVIDELNRRMEGLQKELEILVT